MPKTGVVPGPQPLTLPGRCGSKSPMKPTLFLLLGLAVAVALPSYSLAGNNNNRHQQQPKVVKGGPAKGPSDKSFSETVEGRKNSLGQPQGEEAAMQGDMARKLKALDAAKSQARQDELMVGRLMSMMAADSNCLKRVDADGRTPLHHAAFAGYPKTVRYLLDKGADPKARDLGGATAADMARRAGYPEVAGVIEKR